MSPRRSASSLSTLRESSASPEASTTCAQWNTLPTSMPAQAFSTTTPILRSLACPRGVPPAAPYVQRTFADLYQRSGPPVGTEGRFALSHP